MTSEVTIVDKKSVKEELKQYGRKFSKWAEAYLNPKSETYGNATKSAKATYKCKNYHVANVIGSQCLVKLGNTGLAFTENEGNGAEFWYKVMQTKALKGTYEQVKDYMQTIGILEKETNVPQNQINQQFNLGNIAESFAQARRERGLDKATPVDGADTSDGGDTPDGAGSGNPDSTETREVVT